MTELPVKSIEPGTRLRTRVQNFTVRAAGITTFASLAAALVAFVVNILMSRTLGPTGRGNVAWALQWTYLIAPAVAFGIDRRALRGETGHQSTTRQIWITGSILLLLAIPVRSVPLIVVIAAAMVGAVVSVERGVGMARGSLRSFAVLQLFVQGWTLVASVALYVMHTNFTLPWLLVYAVPVPPLAIYSFRRRAARHTRDLRSIYSSMNFAYTLGGVSSLLAGRVERLLLPVLSNARQLGLYMAVATATELVAWGAKGMGESRVVGLRETEHPRSAVARIFIRDLGIFAIIAVPLGIGIWYLLIPALGSSYLPSRSLVIPLCISSVFWATYLQASSAWLARGRSHQSMFMDAGTAVLTAALALILIPRYGAMGAAIACAIAYAAATLFALLKMPNWRTS